MLLRYRNIINNVFLKNIYASLPTNSKTQPSRVQKRLNPTICTANKKVTPSGSAFLTLLCFTTDERHLNTVVHVVLHWSPLIGHLGSRLDPYYAVC